MSKQKEVIYSIVASTMTHPTADWVYDQARKRMPRISLGTVYRNLHRLCDEGRLLEITTKRSSRYDANVSRHSHLRCLECDRLEDVHQQDLKQPRRIHGYKILESRMELLGLCPECQQNDQT